MSDVFAADFENASVVSFIKNLEWKLKGVKDGEKKFVGLLSSVVWKDVVQHFKDETGEAGAWPKWSSTYAEYMNRIGRGSNKKLQFTGRLRNTFTPQKNRKIPGGILWFNNAKTAGGFPYAFAHDNPGARRTLPRRDFMWLSEKGMQSIEEQTLSFMLEEGI